MNSLCMRRAAFVLLAAASPAPAETLALAFDRAIPLGAENSPDLKAARLDAQISLSGSRVGYLTCIYDYRTALYDLMDAIGTDAL